MLACNGLLAAACSGLTMRICKVQAAAAKRHCALADLMAEKQGMHVYVDLNLTCTDRTANKIYIASKEKSLQPHTVDQLNS